MFARRILFSFAVSILAVGQASAQSAYLAETNLRDACFNNELTMKLQGTISVQQDGKSRTIPRTALATHHYVERILDAKDAAGERSARFYNRAEATITDDKDAYKVALRASHALLVAHRVKDQLVVYHPADALNREEMEIASHLDSLAIPGLLPGKETRVGDTWAVSKSVTQALADLNAVEKSDLTGKLDKIEGDFAFLSFRGLIQGVEMAAPVQLMVKDATAVFNLKVKRIVQVDWRVSDQRQQGPVSPALSADVHFQLKRVPMDIPTQLGDIALVKVPVGAPPAVLTNLSYRNLRKGFEFQYSREWHVVSQSDDGKIVLRLIDARGEFISQCSVTPWQKVDPKNQMKLVDFAKLMRDSKGWTQKDGPALEETDKLRSATGLTLFRVTAEGKLAEVDAVRSFYLVATPNGDQVLVDFTMLPNQASKLEGRDWAMVQSMQFFEAGRIEAVPVGNSK